MENFVPASAMPRANEVEATLVALEAGRLMPPVPVARMSKALPASGGRGGASCRRQKKNGTMSSYGRGVETDESD